MRHRSDLAIPPLRLAAGFLLAAVLALPGGPARAHEVQVRIVPGPAYAVQARYADGRPLAGARFEVYDPGEGDVLHQAGQTDDRGWFAFVPDVPGDWRVKVVDATGHGLQRTVTVKAPELAGGPVDGDHGHVHAHTHAAGAQAEHAPDAAHAHDAAHATPDAGAEAPRPLEAALRPLLGLLVIVAVFGGLWLFYRRRAAGSGR